MDDATAFPSPGNGSEVYADFVRSELAEERARRVRLEQRGLAIITTSGGFTAVLFAVAALAVGKDAFTKAGWAASLVALAVVGLAASGLLAIRATGLDPYLRLGAKALIALRDEAVNKSEEETRHLIATAERKMLVSLRGINDRKVVLLRWSLLSQVLSLLGVFVVVLLLTWGRVLGD